LFISIGGNRRNATRSGLVAPAIVNVTSFTIPCDPKTPHGPLRLHTFALMQRRNGSPRSMAYSAHGRESQDMSKHAIGPMILAASILAVPVLAATQSNEAPNNSPAAASSAASSNTGSNMGAGMTATRSNQANSTAGAPANEATTPRYVTADGQMRLGKIVGASVYNDQNQSVGSIDDVLMSHNNKATMAVISVGGFLGMGSKLVSVPFDQLKVQNDRIVMPGATKASLNGMPEFKYNNA
jgi:sporulation protein YlmC with PRC-barrel domain